MTYPFRARPKRPPVESYMCPDHGVTLGRGAWVRMVMELKTGITRLYFICEFLERVIVEEHPDNSVFYHRAPRVRPKTRISPPTPLIPFDADRRLL